MTTTYVDGEPEQSPSYLNLAAIEAALTYLADTWPHQQMTETQREAWRDVLCQFRTGELVPALRRIGGKFRPDPYATLEAVMGARGSLRAPDFTPTPDEPVTTGAQSAMEACLAQCARLGIGRRAKANA